MKNWPKLYTVGHLAWSHKLFRLAIHENKIVKKPKMRHSWNLSTSKITNYTVCQCYELHNIYAHVYFLKALVFADTCWSEDLTNNMKTLGVLLQVSVRFYGAQVVRPWQCLISFERSRLLCNIYQYESISIDKHIQEFTWRPYPMYHIK